MEFTRAWEGPAHPDTLGQAQNVAATLMARGDYSAAEATYRNSLQEMARTLGSEHAELGTLWLSLGAVRSFQAKYRLDAEASYRRALAISRAAFTSEHEFVERPHQSWPKSVRANSLQGVERNAPRGNWNCPANARIGSSDRRAGPHIA